MSDSKVDQRPAGADPGLDWWATGITELQPGVVKLRGVPIQDLIGKVGYVPMVWLMLRGDMPSARQAELLEAALVASIDHGPQAPSTAVARMAATCGIGLNGALGSAITLLGDQHGGAGEQSLELFQATLARAATGSLTEAVRAELDRRASSGDKFVPGYGKHLHPKDPRSVRLLEVLDGARRDGVIEGRYVDVAREIEEELGRRKGRTIPLNIDGAVAVVMGELGFAPPLARGIFILGRSVGLLAHAWEEMQSGRRNKGPLPPGTIPPYTGR